MTEQELLNYGYTAQNCRAGTLYFSSSNTFFGRLLKDDTFDFRYAYNDTKSVAVVHTIQELRQQEKKYYQTLIEGYRTMITKYEDYIKSNYGDV